MVKNTELDFQSFNKLEIHYWLQGENHSMDAITENRCGHEVIGIIMEIAKIYNFDISIETEALGEGGLRRWLRIISNEEDKKAPITKAILIALVSLVLITPLSKVAEKLIDKIFEDTELTELQKDKLRKEIEGIEIDNQIKLLENPTIKKKKSNFYETLDKNSKVEKVSFEVQDGNKNLFKTDKIIQKEDFKSFILITDELEPLEIDEASIEIISPVLKKGHYKWSGYYNGEPIFFNMKSNEFKTLVQTGKVEFKNGSSINCALIIKKKMDNEGIIKVSGYDVIRVNYYFENDQPIETHEGKRHRNKKNDNSQQMNLFSSLDENPKQ